MQSVRADKINEVYATLDSEELFILKELVDYFTYEVPGAKFMPAYKNKIWDGKIRLFNPVNRKIYVGLLSQVKSFCERNDYKFEYLNDEDRKEFVDENLKELAKYVSPKSGGKSLTYRDYQLDAVQTAINKDRCLLLSPTASGKSLIIYTLIRFYLLHPEIEDKKILIVVPTTSLVSQMYKDFEDYGYDVEKNCHMIYQGQSKTTEKRIVISTWQSIYKESREYFNQFGVVVGDECHLFKANSLSKLMEKLVNCKYRFGTTGTLDGTKTHKLVLTGLFGDIKKVTTTKTLIDNQTLSKFKIECLVLNYEENNCKTIKGLTYQQEIEWIVLNEKRNKFIVNLSSSLKGNTLVLFNYVEKHGKPLYNAMKDKCKDKNVFYVSGETGVNDREKIREIAEKIDDAIIIASYGTFSTGINIKNLHNVVFASPSKSKIRNLQSIGRGLRKGDKKQTAVLYDIVDNLKYKSYTNFAMRHFYERINIYNEESFDFKINEIRLYGRK